MADLQNFSITAGSAAQVTVLDWVIEARVQDGETVLSDFTGSNALHFQTALATMTESQQRDLIGQIAPQMIMILAGLAS